MLAFAPAAALAAMLGGGAHAADTIQMCRAGVLDDSVTYQAVFQPTCHNCYQIDVAKAMGANTFKQVLDQVLNVEIDIWDTKDDVSGGKKKEWYVRHNPGTLFQSGNDNNCTGNGQGTNNLAACLGDIRDWSDAHPGHAPITLFLDKKQNWSKASSERTPLDLDELVNQKLGRKLFTPSNLKRGYASLRAAANAGDWPARSALAGSVLVVLTGGEALKHNQTLNAYVKARKTSAALFVAPDTDEAGDITGTPTGFDSEYAGYVVFYNIKNGDDRDELGKRTRTLGYVSRLWDADDANTCAILANCVNDNALKKWDQAACSGQAAGRLALLDPAGWLPQQRESASLFTCPTDTVTTGRWHDCHNKGERCDENGDSSVYCRRVERGGVAYTVAEGTWSQDVVESAGTPFLCPQNTVMTGRRHDCGNKDDGKKCDENGTTRYLCASLAYNGQPVNIVPENGIWTAYIEESTSQFVCPDELVLNGRQHDGDENGKTRYHCISVPAP
jgi:hypothetical protein